MQASFKTSIKIDIERQAASDVAKRAMPGTFIYLLCWLMIIIPTGFFKQQPVFVACFSSLLVILSLFRIILIRKFEVIYSHNPMIWTSLIYFNVLISGLAWGILYAISISNTAFASISFLIVISLAGNAGGGSIAFSPDQKLSIALIFILLMPTIVTLVFFSTEFDLALCLLFITYIIGLLAVSHSTNREYWNALKGSVLIMNYAAELERLNTLDGLTGLKNRKFFDEELEMALKRAERQKTEISLLIMDIDHFKAINDNHGHLAGDHCLRTVAEVFNTVVKRETDTIVRYGGEEFAAILPGLSEKQACEFAEKIRLRVEETEIPWSVSSLSLTISIGVSSVWPKNNLKSKHLINSADKALYKAKKEGRNRVAFQKFDRS